MRGSDRRIDPVTRDYIDDGAGGYLETLSLETAVVHQVLDEYGADPGDELAGSTIHLLPKRSNGVPTRAEARNAAAVALQPLITAGLARNARVIVEQDGTRLLVETQITDVNAGADVEDLAVVVPLE
jgi:phage gp46-like protein